ncbi:unnamed protein product [Brachionus calyciflorus]|uniref:Ima1 N-terminal domain-containing protein n=1 Tax=Brachionus calyciflorus TaxID=104777 RepID=A0A814ESL7_9BILA|nr:unnamed protein product [Brachionus calyciflorus]
MLFGLKLNCWFCNQNSRISFFKRNSWTCPHCNQYNGFNEDGSYNKEIPEMHRKPLTNPFHSTKKINPKLKKPSLLCEKCTNNQCLKIERLSNFQPQREETYDLEIELYKEYMEKIYDLCSLCKPRVKFEITKQDGIIKQYLYKIGQFDYLFERGFKIPKLPKKPDLKKILKNQSKFARISYFFMNLFILFLVILTLFFNVYPINELDFITSQYTSFLSHPKLIELRTTYIYLNQYIPLYLISVVFLTLLLLLINKQNLKSFVLIFSLELSLIIVNYENIVYNLKYQPIFIYSLSLTPIFMIPILIINIFNMVNLIIWKDVNPKPKIEVKKTPSSAAAIIPNFNSGSNLNKMEVIQPAKFKPISKSLFNYKIDSNDRIQASLNSSDLSTRGSDDDSSSIVSGLTNLYLDRGRSIEKSNYLAASGGFLPRTNESNYYSLYQSDITIRNRSMLSSKWPQSQMSKKEIFVVY